MDISVDGLLKAPAPYLVRPFGFEDWLLKNASQYDPILKNRNIGSHIQRKLESRSPLKCSKPRCIHYIYGFETLTDLNKHMLKQHASQTGHHKILEKGASPQTRLSTPSGSPSCTLFDADMSSRAVSDPSASTVISITRHNESAANAISKQDFPTSSQVYSFIPEYPALSENTGWNASLHPPKRSRPTPLGLNSREETRLVRNIGPCLRCKVLKKKVRHTVVRSWLCTEYL